MRKVAKSLVIMAFLNRSLIRVTIAQRATACTNKPEIAVLEVRKAVFHKAESPLPRILLCFPAATCISGWSMLRFALGSNYNK